MAPRDYFPTKDEWLSKESDSIGINPAALAKAVHFAESEAQTRWPVDLDRGLAAANEYVEPPPWDEVIGPTKPRGGANGLLLRHGYIIAEWGDTQRVDMTFSVAKSYLAVLTGLALDDGLIASIDDPVRDYALDAGFEAAQNQTISWRHLLQQTSEWEGSLWDKPDLVDRNREVGEGADNSRKGRHRDLQKPGTYWEYNDVRVNRLALTLMQVFRRPLPEVLKQRVMDPVSASTDWLWHGYRNSYFAIGDEVMHSVPGGSHWGGGLWIAARDHARLALLIARRGQWRGQRILAERWIDELTTPCPLNKNYGLLWWLNQEGLYPSAPATSFFAMGAGTHLLWIDPVLDLVAVIRWIDNSKIDTFCAKVMASIEE